MGKATADNVFQIYYVPRLFFGPVCVPCVFPSYIRSCPKAKCCFPCVLVRKIVYLTCGRHTTSAVSHLVDFDLVTCCTQL